MKSKKVGKTIAIVLLVILVIFLGYLSYNYFVGITPTQKIERKLEKLTKSFFEDYYYDLVLNNEGSKKGTAKYLSQFKKTGLRISLDSLKAYYDNNGGMNYTMFAKCDENKTQVIIYPKKPYTRYSYKLDTELSCKKSN